MGSNYISLLRTVILTCCAVFILPCKGEKTRSEAEQVINIDNCEKVKTINYNDRKFIESYKMVQLELGQNSIVGEITQLQLLEGCLYILDRRAEAMWVFNLDGSFSHKIGVKGRGPKEYLALNAFYINPDKKEITLFDPLNLQGQTFDLDGKFIATKKLPEDLTPQSFCNMRYIGGNQVVCYANPGGMVENVLFILNDEDMSIVDKLATRPMKLDQTIYKAATQPYSIVDGKLHYVKWFDNNIYQYNRGETKPIMEIDVNKPIVPQEVLDVTAENNAGDFFATVRQLINDGKYSVGLKNLYETSRFIFCEFEYDSPISDFIVWDKVAKNGTFVTDQSLIMPGIRNIVYSSDDKLVSYWSYNLIMGFQDQLKNDRIDRSSIDTKIVEALETYDMTKDNPILFVYDIVE